MTLIPITTQMWYDAGWNDESQYHLNTETTSVRRGVSREGGIADETEVGLLLRNPDRRFTVGHPSSALYGKVGRNTPLRVSVGTPWPGAANGSSVDSTSHVAPSVVAPAAGVLICAFAAPQATGTYTAPAGMTATATTSGSQLRIGGGRQVIGSAGATGTRTATFSIAEDYVAVSAFIPGPTSLSTGTTANSTGQITIDGNVGDWWVLLTAYASATATTSIPAGIEFRPHLDYPWDSDGGGWIKLADTGSLFVGDLDAQYLRMRVFAKRVKHTHASHIISTALFNVPLGGDLTGDTERLSILTRIPAAEVGLWSPRAHVKLSRAPAPRRDVSGNYRAAAVNAGGWLRDLGASTQQPLQSPLRQALSDVDSTIGYWPMEDGSDATQLPAATPGIPAGHLAGAVNPAAYSGFVASLPVPTSAGGHVRFKIPGHAAGAEYHHMLLSIPSGGLTDQQQVFSLRMSDQLNFQVRYGTGGSLNLMAFDASGTLLDQTGGVAFAVDGDDFFFQLRLEQDGADLDTVMKVTRFDAGTSEFVDTFPGITLRASIRTRIGHGGDPSGLSMGHYIATTTDLLVGSGAVSLFRSLEAFAGEQAAGRIRRLCREVGVPLAFVGDPAQTRYVGPQQRGTLLELLRQAEAADHGILYESKEELALVYRTGNSLGRHHGGTTAYQWTTQPSTLTLDADNRELAPPWQPNPDDFLVRNDVTVARIDGAAARSVQETGPLNTSISADDPDGIGPRPYGVDLNLHDDYQPANHARFMRWLGTQPEPRFPQVPIDMLRHYGSDQDLAAAAAALDPGDRLTIANPPDDVPDDDMHQLVLGYGEELKRDGWRITANCAPAVPYTVGVRRSTSDTVAAADPSRRDTDGSELNASFVAGTDTSMSVLVTAGQAWVQTAAANADFPFDVEVGGARVRVSAIGAPAAGVQTFTASATVVNGIAKTIPAGTPVKLWQPAVRALGGAEDA